jgi:putative radical SAM enzyme (TIGR03279 family)
MTERNGHLIDRVTPGSPAESAGIRAGWKLLRIDNQAVGDIIDYKIMESDDQLRLLIQDENGTVRRIRVKKGAGKPLGIRFDPPTITQLQQCGNNCLFCFVRQNPPDMRPALYVRDDDYRLSFLYGNFITLNRVSDAEIERIIKLQLSPLYVSVHTTNPELRQKMFGTKKATKGLANLHKLINAGIRIHAQVVLCPGFNTDSELMRTIDDLNRLGSNILSVALVPVGLTGYRSGLEPLRRYTPAEAAALIGEIHDLQSKFLQSRGSRFVFPSDEFYTLAGIDFPEDHEYESYPQLENGVGLARQFLNEIDEISKLDLNSSGKELIVTIAAGTAAERLIDMLINMMNRYEGLRLKKIIADNLYFGKEVTVSGLLTGSDLRAALEGKEAGDALFISDALLKEDSNLFLDNTTLQELERNLGIPVFAVSGPRAMFGIIKEIFNQEKTNYKGVKTSDK